MSYRNGGKTMKKRVVAIMITFALILISGVQASYAVSTSTAELLEDKLVYHTEESDYLEGDCVLSATRIMIRRAGIMNEDNEWTDLTNAKLRPHATEDGLMHNSFSYTDDGITYSISTGTFEGEDKAARIKEFAELVRSHPEGVVVFGADAAETGTHGVLLVDVIDGVVYAADTSNNMGDRNKGIQKWKDTTMLDPSLCTDYWYISEISVGGKPAADVHNERRFTPLIPKMFFA